MSISNERTIPRLVEAAARAWGPHNAIEDGDVTLTFPALEAARLQSARAFAASGISPGDCIGIWAPNIHEWIVAAIGLQSVGAVLVPMNTRMKGAEAAYVLRKSQARMVLTVGDFLGENYVSMLDAQDLPELTETVVFRSEEPGCTSWADFLARADGVSEDDARERSAAVTPDDLSDIMFTSGTTGNPKGVMAAHGQNLRCFEAWTEVIGLNEADRYLIVNPFFHAFGYKAGWLSCIMRGSTILPHQVFDVPAVLERVGRERVSVLPGPPTLYQSILSHPEREKYDLTCLRLAVTGAAAVPVELVHRMQDELSFETVITGYGLTEACGIVTMCRFDDDPETIALTSGRAIPDVEVRCIDDDGKEVPRGEPGELVLRGYNVMQGYLDDAEETAAAIDVDGWLYTGDIAVMDERGYVRITDRKKDMFIMGGFNCYPAEIENLMFNHDDIAQVAVIGIPDERMGEVGMAFVVPTHGATLEPDSVRAWCREHMANYKVPRRISVVDALPTNATGKVTKFTLSEWAEQDGAGPGGAS